MDKADCAKVTNYCDCNSVLHIRCHGVQRDSVVTCRSVLYANSCEGLQGDQYCIHKKARNKLIQEIVIIIPLILRTKYLAYI